jgi:hypothetical protein
MESRITAFLGLVVVIAGCGGSLSDEQRKAVRERMEENKIVRVTEAEITEAAYSAGRKLVQTLDSLANDSVQLQAFLNRRPEKIRYLTPDAANARLLEKQLIDAYLADESGSFQDNVQEVRNTQGGSDSLLYTMPVITKRADGIDQLEGVWNIWLSRKALILEMAKGH